MLIFCCCLTEAFCEINNILSLWTGVTFSTWPFFIAQRDSLSTSRTGSSREFHSSTWTSRRFCSAFCRCASSLFSICELSVEHQRFLGTGSFSPSRFDFPMILKRYCLKIFKNWTSYGENWLKFAIMWNI